MEFKQKSRWWFLDKLEPFVLKQKDSKYRTAPLRQILLALVAESEFIKAYIQTSLWATNDESTPSGGEPLDKRFKDANDFATPALARIVQECLEFQVENYNDLHVDGVKCGPDFGNEGRGGHDFFLTRHGHGCGFWDGDWPEAEGERLTKASKKFGESEPYIGGNANAPKLWVY